jgi:membrane protease YdiL (CAAX protease family)
MVERLRAPWQPWEAIPVVGAALATAVIASVVFAAIFGSPGGSALLLTSLAFQAALAAFTLLWVAVRHRGWVPALGLRSARTASDVALGAWAGASVFGLAAFVVLPVLQVVWRVVTGGAPPEISQPVVPLDPTPVQIVLAVAAVVIGAPVGEELFFRGFLFLVMVFVGIALAYLYDRRGSLATSIAAHAMFNLIGFTLIVMQSS